jgi:uncharacterized membrane protein
MQGCFASMIRLELPQRRSRRIALLLLSLAFVAAGGNHFVNPEVYLAIMPDYLPAHRLLVAASGVCEILGGIGVLLPRVRSLAGVGIVALLVAVFPANLQMALHPERFPDIPPVLTLLRLPLQILLVAWAWWATRSDAPVTGKAPDLS